MEKLRELRTLVACAFLNHCKPSEKIGEFYYIHRDQKITFNFDDVIGLLKNEFESLAEDVHGKEFGTDVSIKMYTDMLADIDPIEEYEGYYTLTPVGYDLISSFLNDIINARKITSTHRATLQ